MARSIMVLEGWVECPKCHAWYPPDKRCDCGYVERSQNQSKYLTNLLYRERNRDRVRKLRLEQNRRYRAKHPDRKKMSDARYRAKHRDQINAKSRQSYQKRREYHHEYYLRNRSRIAGVQRQYHGREDVKERLQNYQREYRQRPEVKEKNRLRARQKWKIHQQQIRVKGVFGGAPQ